MSIQEELNQVKLDMQGFLNRVAHLFDTEVAKAKQELKLEYTEKIRDLEFELKASMHDLELYKSAYGDIRKVNLKV